MEADIEISGLKASTRIPYNTHTHTHTYICHRISALVHEPRSAKEHTHTDPGNR